MVTEKGERTSGSGIDAARTHGPRLSIVSCGGESRASSRLRHPPRVHTHVHSAYTRTAAAALSLGRCYWLRPLRWRTTRKNAQWARKSPIGSGGGLSLIHLARASSQLSPARDPLVTAAACACVYVCTSETLGAFRFCTYGLHGSPQDTAARATTRRAVIRPQPPPVGLVPSLHYPFFVPPPNMPLECSPRLPASTPPPPPPLLCSSSRRAVTKATATTVERYTLQHAQSSSAIARALSASAPRARFCQNNITRSHSSWRVRGGGGAPDRLPSRTATDEMTALLVRQPPPHHQEARLPFSVRGHHRVYNIYYIYVGTYFRHVITSYGTRNDRDRSRVVVLNIADI